MLSVLVIHRMRSHYTSSADKRKEIGGSYKAIKHGQSGPDKLKQPAPSDQFEPAVQSSHLFLAHETRRIAGGLCGLGREATRWMVVRGTRHILPLDPKGFNGPVKVMSLLNQSSNLLVKHFDQHATVSTVTLLTKCFRRLVLPASPAVRVCIQGAMKPNDDAVANMPFEAAGCFSTQACGSIAPRR